MKRKRMKKLMKITQTAIPEVKILEPRIFRDDRGYFFESFNSRLIAETLNIPFHFVQDNHSHSIYGVLRGLHYQLQKPQGKLVRLVSGEVFDVAVDLRKGSTTFGKWVGILLNAESQKMVWIPPGFAHGFLVLSERADFLYKTTDYYDPTSEYTLLWNDPEVNIIWPFQGEPNLSLKDKNGKKLKEAPIFL